MQYQTVLGYDWEPLKNPELRSLIYDIGPKLYVDSRRFVALVNVNRQCQSWIYIAHKRKASNAPFRGFRVGRIANVLPTQAKIRNGFVLLRTV